VSLPTCVRQRRRGSKATILAVLTVLAPAPVAGQSGEPVDLQAIHRIKDEGLQRSKVMRLEPIVHVHARVVRAVHMMQNAVIVASFVYHAANRDLLLPRKPLPAPPRPAPSAQ
jgi:hypothetical protein